MKFIGRIREAPRERKKEWFEAHIKPSYEKLVEIHNDYQKQFQCAVDLLRQRTELKEIVEILKRERLHKLLDRREVRENLQALNEYRRDRRRKPKVALLFYDYVSAVDEYLNAASPLPPETWYQYFIETFSRLVEEGRDPFEWAYPGRAQGKDTVKTAIKILDDAVQRNMPEAMGEVQAIYAKLRAECLSDL